MTLQPAPTPPTNNPSPTSLTSPTPARPQRASRGRGAGRLIALAVGGLGLFLVLVLAGHAMGVIRVFGEAERPDLLLHRVGYERIQLTITDRGQLESAENSDIVCRVKARSANSTIATQIRTLYVEDGQQVRKGEKLVQLDDSGLVEQLKTQKITLDQARAGWVQADKNFEITESQNNSDIETAKLNLQLVQIDLRKYKQGEYIQQLKEVEGRLLIAQSDQEMWEERSSWSARMSRPGRRYVTAAQAQADEARLKSAQVALSKVQEEKRVLERFTKQRTEMDLTGKIEEAKRALARVQAQAKAKMVQAEADRSAKLSVYLQEQGRHKDIQDEIDKCLIRAPQSGLVVYYVPEQARFGSGSQQSTVAQGEPVREGQKLMRIPDLTKMVVNTRVHEAMISRVRGEVWKPTGFGQGVRVGLLAAGTSPLDRLVRLEAYDAVRDELGDVYRSVMQQKTAEGQPAKVRVEAYPDRFLEGEVKTVATVASQQDWLSADVKVYQTMVAIKESLPGLKPGMSAEVTIYTDSQRDNVLAVPVQAILGSVDMGKTRRVYVMTQEGARPREVVVGLTNDRLAEIESGLSEGDMVVLNPRVLLSEKERAALGDTPRQGGGKEKGKGGLGGGGKGKGGPPPGGGGGGGGKGEK